MKEITFKKGKYYIGDPCYIFNDVTWDEVLNDTKNFKNIICEFRGEKIFVGESYFGDGIYHDNTDRIYAIDSGTLGIIPAILIEKEARWGYVIDFKKDFQVKYSKGNFYFGDIKIKTK